MIVERARELGTLGFLRTDDFNNYTVDEASQRLLTVTEDECEQVDRASEV